MRKLFFVIFCKYFLLVFLSNSTLAYPPAKLDSIPLKRLPKSIVISSVDVKNFGGWPIERRWFSILIKKLQQMGAKRVFIDIAFPSADVLHPESDELFYFQLCEWPNVYLLTTSENNVNSQMIILGSKSFNPQKTFIPFSEGFSVKEGHLLFQKNRGTLVDFFLPPDFKDDVIILDLPEEEMIPDYKFNQVLLENISFQGDDVIVYLDYPGISSYILTSKPFTTSTSSLQIQTIKQILTGNYKIYWPLWRFVAFALIILILPMVGYFIPRISTISIVISLAAWVVISIVLYFGKIYIEIWWFLILIPPVIIFSKKMIPTIWKRKWKGTASSPTGITEEHGNKDSEQIKNLQYRLDYYEKLSTQIPISTLANGYESNGIYCHGSSPFVDILRKAEQVAKNDIPVIIYGESGTGKEKLAQFIHHNSEKQHKPFIAVNCGALNDNLIESELFGYEKGAFTGAYQQKPGRFELANGGTLFLDEVSETSLAFQIKLLRVLQEGVFERVGGTKPIHVSVRIIAATHQNLERAIERGTFREDLFYRLNGYEFSIPALRSRTMDIEYLFKHFLYETDPNIKYSEPLIEWLKDQLWPGNVRQLKTTTRRAIINAQVHNRSFLIPKDFELASVKKDTIDNSDKLSERILERFRDHEFHYRSISAVASDLMLHRSTVTEYLRGWVIRFLNMGNSDTEYVISSMRGTAPVVDESKYRSRIFEYIDYIQTRIKEGVESGYSELEIQSKLFRNLPGVYRDDLIQLIQKIRNPGTE
jgi:hypothetical protein